MKEDYKGNAKRNFIILLLMIILVLAFFIVGVMPKRVCHIETRTEVIELGHYETINADKKESRSYDIKPEFLCENGVSIDDLDNINIIWFTGRDKICVVKYKEEICEIK